MYGTPFTLGSYPRIIQSCINNPIHNWGFASQSSLWARSPHFVAAVGLTCVIQPKACDLRLWQILCCFFPTYQGAPQCTHILQLSNISIPKLSPLFKRIKLASPGRCLSQCKSFLSRVLGSKTLAVHVYDDKKNDAIANIWFSNDPFTLDLLGLPWRLRCQ